ncbi:Hsp20/alpha crystallin family protein [Caldibacillus lycopersici]|uniref:Hsp20/alpha crystallin family protein n=1 Tax=Perspicuibacillus lycopersici TaxID=1325689 RepID=A0AAE3IUJ0_9BACI|nr:Hsp20/alpha crystallin family protein [Perspicuibacillus lycopersici]MCU9613671.1 Hsp20/alpha crystallin family protein [Perspicuibacillus lycopersici]
MNENLPKKSNPPANGEVIKEWFTNHPLFHEMPIGNVLESINAFFRNGMIKPSFKVMVKETDTDYILTAELPGVKKENIAINIMPNNATITVKQYQIEIEENDVSHTKKKTSSFEQMTRTIPFYHPVNDRGAKASYRDGLLKIHIPKKFGKSIIIEE